MLDSEPALQPRGSTFSVALWARPVRFIALAFVLLLALDHYTNHLARTPGIDFYQYWAVPTARRVSAEPLGSPYTDSARYAEVLAGVAERSTDNRLKAVTEYRAQPGFASDPLLYVLGGWLPSDYTLALRLYQALQLLALGWALFLLGRRAAVPWPDQAILGSVMYVYYMPVLSELRVLNTNAFQLVAVALAVVLLSEREVRSSMAPAAALSLLVFVAFLKPLWAPLVLLTLFYLGRIDGWAATRRPLAVAAGTAAVLFAWPVVVFGPSVWSDWYRTVFADDPDHLVYAVGEGNRSAPLVLAEATGWSLNATTLVIGLVLLVSLGLSLLAANLRAGKAERPARLRDFVPWLGASPQVVLGLGVVALLALSPLVWWHYYTIALVPVFAMVGRGSSRAQIGLACLSVLLSSGRLGPVYAWFGDADWATICGVSLAWLPLWIGLLLPGSRSPETFVTE